LTAIIAGFSPVEYIGFMNVKDKLPHLFAIKVDDSYDIYTSKQHGFFDELVNVICHSDDAIKTYEYRVVTLKSPVKKQHTSLIRRSDRKIFNIHTWFYTNSGLDVESVDSTMPVIRFEKDVNDFLKRL
jgi:hypothetical protein